MKYPYAAQFSKWREIPLTKCCAGFLTVPTSGPNPNLWDLYKPVSVLRLFKMRHFLLSTYLTAVANAVKAPGVFYISSSGTENLLFHFFILVMIKV